MRASICRLLLILSWMFVTHHTWIIPSCNHAYCDPVHKCLQTWSACFHCLISIYIIIHLRLWTQCHNAFGLKACLVLHCPNCILLILRLLLFPSLDSARHLPVSLFGGLCRNYICGKWGVKILHLFSVAVTWINSQSLSYFFFYLPAVMRLPAVIWL